MFKLFVIVMLCVIAIHACASADMAIATINVPLSNQGYIWFSYNDYSNVISVPFNVPVYYWSY